MAASKKGVGATQKKPCPVCGKPDWCILFEDGGCNCYRCDGPGAKEKTDDQGDLYWAHPAGAGESFERSRSAERLEPAVMAATADQRNRLYAELQSQLSLSADHQEQLLSRGLVDLAVREHGFRSIHTSAVVRSQIAESLARLFPWWGGVPGLVEQKGKPRLAASKGLCLFLRDPAGRIQAVQLRYDQLLEGGRRYGWLTSSKNGGPSPGAPASFWRPLSRRTVAGKVRVAEGVFKALVAAEFTGVPGIASGSGGGGMASPQILDWLEELRPDLVMFTPDQDAYLKPEVAERARRCLGRLMALGRRAGFRLEVEVWQTDLPPDQRAKGIDDALAVGAGVHTVPPEDYSSGLPFGESGPGTTAGLETLGDPGENQWELNRLDYPTPAPVDVERGSETGWTKPEPFLVRDDDLLTVPLWVLPQSLRRMVQTVSDAKQVTSGTVMGSLVGLLSSICGGRYCANLASQYETHGHVWILLSLRSSGGKSEAVKALAKPIFRAQKRLQEETQKQNDVTAAERANLLKQVFAMESGGAEDYPGQLSEARARLKEVAARPLPRFVWKDVSPQKLDVLYARHQRVAIVSPESADWITLVMGYGKDQGPTLGSCLSGFSVEPHGSDRVTREESHCERPVLTLFLACQEDDVKNFIGDPVARRRGFLGRTLVFRGQSLVGRRRSYDKRPDLTASDLHPWNALVEVVTGQVPKSDDEGWVPLPIPVSDQARSLFCRLFDVVEKRLSENSPDLRLDELEDIAGRSLEQVGRLAVLLHVLWTAPRGVLPTAESISEATVFRAFALMLWALQGFLDLSSPATEGAHNAALSLWKDLLASPLCNSGSCTVKEWVRSGPNRWRSSTKLDAQLSILEGLGYIQVVNRRNIRGPASRVIDLNPLARRTDPETAATVATVLENPLFIEVIQAQPHLRRYCDGCDGMENAGGGAVRPQPASPADDEAETTRRALEGIL